MRRQWTTPRAGFACRPTLGQHWPMRRLVLTVLLVCCGSAARADAPPLCTEEREGMVGCLGETLCICRLERGGMLTGRSPGYRWECGPLRPSCGVVPPGQPGAEVPAMVLQPSLQLPWPGLGRGPEMDARPLR